VSRRLGVREERRIVGEHVLTDQEARGAAVFADAVAVNTYHLDLHWPDRAERAGTGVTEMVEPYHIPLRSLIPKGARNLLVPGRGASAEQLALSSFRVMGVVQAMGFAAGRATAQCLAAGTDLSGLDVAALQQTLERDGQSLDLSDYGEYQRKLRLTREQVFGEGAGFASCHASTLVQLRNGRFLVAWFGGSREGHADTAIWLAERARGAWGPPRRVAKVDAQPHWNPVLFRAPDATLHLFFRVGSDPRHWSSWTMTSSDSGASWSEPRRLRRSGGVDPGPVKNKPIVLEDGTWLAPNSLETAERWDVLVDRSRDGGASWEGVPISFDPGALRGGGAIQPALWESASGQVHMLVRTTGGRIWRSDSDDGGRTWRPLWETPLPNPNAGFDVARLRDGTLALVHNPGDTPGVRTPLSISLSFDDGRSWPHRLDLEIGEGEYSYPAVIPTAVGMAISYTWRRRGIGFWHGSIEQVTMPGTAFGIHTICPVAYDELGEPILSPRRIETI
jgi:predicted neuraminidase